MRAVVTRVSSASVAIDGNTVGAIEKGYLVLLGVGPSDTEAVADKLAEKICNLRVFEDENGKMNLSLEDIGGEMLVVSNFTLGTDCKKGRRPSFDLAAPPQEADRLYQRFVAHAKEQGIRKVETGEFGAYMDVLCANDGPVNIIIDTERIGK